MLQFIYVAVGGALGALSRFSLSQWVDKLQPGQVPWGTFTVNVIGSLFIGVLFVIIVEKELIHSDFRYFLIAGFLGAFTTYSAFSFDTIRLLEEGQFILASSYIFGTTFTCVLGAWIGMLFSRLVF